MIFALRAREGNTKPWDCQLNILFPAWGLGLTGAVGWGVGVALFSQWAQRLVWGAASGGGLAWDAPLCLPLTSVDAVKTNLGENNPNLKYLIIIISNV